MTIALSTADRRALHVQLALLAYGHGELPDEDIGWLPDEDIGWRLCGSVNRFRERGTEALVIESERDVWVAFAGTDPTCWADIKADLDLRKIRVSDGWFFRGFWRHVVERDIFGELMAQLHLSTSVSGKAVHIIGHSLGGAAATVLAYQCALTRIPVETLETYGSPRVCSAGPAELIELHVRNIVRHVNNNDAVARHPVRFGVSHVGPMTYHSSQGRHYYYPSGLFVLCDRIRGRWDAWRSGCGWRVLLDGFADHSMQRYLEVVR